MKLGAYMCAEWQLFHQSLLIYYSSLEIRSLFRLEFRIKGFEYLLKYILCYSACIGLRNWIEIQYFLALFVGNAASYFGIDPLFSLTGVPSSMDIGVFWNGNEGIVFTGCKWLRWIDLVLSEYCKSLVFVLRSRITKTLQNVRQNIAANFPDGPACLDRHLLYCCHATIVSIFRFCQHVVDIASWIPSAKIRVLLNTYSSSTWINMLCSFESKLGDNILTAKQRIVRVLLPFRHGQLFHV